MHKRFLHLFFCILPYLFLHFFLHYSPFICTFFMYFFIIFFKKPFPREERALRTRFGQPRNLFSAQSDCASPCTARNRTDACCVRGDNGFFQNFLENFFPKFFLNIFLKKIQFPDGVGRVLRESDEHRRFSGGGPQDEAAAELQLRGANLWIWNGKMILNIVLII